MNIKGKMYLFVNKHETKKGEEVTDYTTTISSKDINGEYIHMLARVRFTGEKITKEKLSKLSVDEVYEIEVEKGFLSCDKIATKDAKIKYYPVFVIEDAKVLSHKEIKKTVASGEAF